MENQFPREVGMQLQSTESWWPFLVPRPARSTLADFLLSAASSPHTFGQLVCDLTESDALLTIITTVKKACTDTLQPSTASPGLGRLFEWMRSRHLPKMHHWKSRSPILFQLLAYGTRHAYPDTAGMW